MTAKKTRVPYVVKSGHAINSKPSSDKAILLVRSTLTWKTMNQHQSFELPVDSE